MITICLPATLQHDLNWSSQREEALAAVSASEKILWQFDFGLNELEFSRTDSSSFFSFTIALEEFSKSLYKEFETHTQGIVLYRGKVEFDRQFPMSAWEEVYREHNEMDYRLFCMQMLSQYLHRLLSFLPDSSQVYLLFDLSFIESAAFRAQLLSKERFEYFNLSLDVDLPPLGVCLPLDTYCNEQSLRMIDKTLSQLQEKYRIISEAKLNEEWNELDRLVVFPEYLSTQGKRKIQGFIAAGGEVLTAPLSP